MELKKRYTGIIGGSVTPDGLSVVLIRREQGRKRCALRFDIPEVLPERWEPTVIEEQSLAPMIDQYEPRTSDFIMSKQGERFLAHTALEKWKAEGSSNKARRGQNMNEWSSSKFAVSNLCIP